jgi:hypothetical protein
MDGYLNFFKTLEETIKDVKIKLFFSEFCRLKRTIPKKWYVLLSEEKYVNPTTNIKRKIYFLQVG